MTNFNFLQAEWSAVFEAAEKAEAAMHPDPRTACFYARRSLELAVAWLFKIEFVDLIVNHLTEHGIMDATLLYESPFTDITPTGPDGLFTSAQVDELVLLLDELHARAVA